MTRGGKRKGAGRHKSANKKIRYTIRFRPDQLEWMRLNLPIREKGGFIREADFIREAVDEKIERIMNHESINSSKA